MPSNPKNTRKCAVCRGHADKSELIRFVKCDGEIIVDKDKNLGGRGVWVHNNADCLNKLKKKKLLNAAFRCDAGEKIYGELGL